MLGGRVESAWPARVHDGVDLTIRRGERWSVMGRNGAGKTTLLKMIAGALAPTVAAWRIGASVKWATSPSSRPSLDLDLTIWEQIDKDFPLEPIGALRNLLGAFSSPARMSRRRSARSPEVRRPVW